MRLSRVSELTLWQVPWILWQILLFVLELA